jgi:hypothetical protein
MEDQFEPDDPLFRLALNQIRIDIESGPMDNPEKFRKAVAGVLTPYPVIPQRYTTLVNFNILSHSDTL